MSNNKLAIIGLATMGSNFAKNFASRGIFTAVYNRTYSKTEELIAEKNDNIEGFQNLEDCIKSLELPRKVFLLVKAGEGTDKAIEQITPMLDKNDIIVDCGNSNWNDTIKRQSKLLESGIHFIGCGISGGSDGALLGPSLMPGGEKNSVDVLLPFLDPVAAKDFEGKPCVTNVGLSGAGHFVKMVHNGIEYAMMQGIAEVYHILKSMNYQQPDILKSFQTINTGSTKSFLTDIACQILATEDNLDSGWLLQKVDYKAGAKGTGKWTIESAMDLGVAVPSIYAGLNARVMSELNAQMKDYARKDNIEVAQQPAEDLGQLTDILHRVIDGIYLVSYSQGLELIHKANTDYNWNINILEVLRIWQGGCIIRSNMLKSITESYTNGIYPKTEFDSAVHSILELYSILSRNNIHIPFPVINSVKDYILTIESDNLPQNFVQAQRDLFGAHTYLRTDREGVFTGGWAK
jgi:6-phosphogluconate dehydrogenase